MAPVWTSTPPIVSGTYWYYGNVYHGEAPRFKLVKVAITASGSPTYFVQESLLYAEDFNRLGVKGIWTDLVYPELPEEYKD